jgi:hypothetical protein
MSKSRSSIFSTWSTTSHPVSKGSISTTTTSPTSQLFSPSSTNSSPSPSTGPNSPSLCLSLSDPFSCSINLPEPYRPSQTQSGFGYPHGSSTYSPDSHSQSKHPHTYTYHSPHALHSQVQSKQKASTTTTQTRYGYPNPTTTSLVSGTEHTPKIVVASPSTGTIHYLFPDLAPGSARVGTDTSPTSGAGGARSKGSGDKEKGSRLDPSAAKTIARNIFKRQSRSTSDLRSIGAKPPPRVIESFYIPNPQLPPGSRPDPLKPTQRIPSGSSSTSTSTTTIATGTSSASTSGTTAVSRNEKHPLSMRTLRRQPSMADLTVGRKRGEAFKESLKENARENGGTRDVSSKRHSGAWKSLGSRRESDSWRELVNSMTRDEVSCCRSPGTVLEHQLMAEASTGRH